MTNFVNAPLGVVNIDGGTLNLNVNWHNAGTINTSSGTVNLGGTFTFGDVGTFNRSGSGTVNLTGTLNNIGGTLALNPSSGSWLLKGGNIIGGTFSRNQMVVPFVGFH